VIVGVWLVVLVTEEVGVTDFVGVNVCVVVLVTVFVGLIV
jgi:hypothetical protein